MTGLVTIRDIRAAGEQEIHKSSHFGLCSQSRCDRPPGHACCQEAKTNWHSETLSETHKNQLHKSLQVSPYEEMLCRTDMELTSAYMGKTLNSWKEIAVYLGLGVRTAQRWELQLNLPVHRIGSGSRSPVFAFKAELDVWIRHQPGQNGQDALPFGAQPNRHAHPHEAVESLSRVVRL